MADSKSQLHRNLLIGNKRGVKMEKRGGEGAGKDEAHLEIGKAHDTSEIVEDCNLRNGRRVESRNALSGCHAVCCIRSRSAKYARTCTRSTKKRNSEKNK
jgi:hypothetical protein